MLKERNVSLLQHCGAAADNTAIRGKQEAARGRGGARKHTAGQALPLQTTPRHTLPGRGEEAVYIVKLDVPDQHQVQVM